MIEKINSYAEILQNNKLKILFFSLFTAVLATLVYIYQYFIYPFLFALVLYIALRPLHELITRYIKQRSLSSIIVVISLILLVLIPLFTILLALADQTYELYIYLQHQYNAGILKNIIDDSKILNKLFSLSSIGKDELISQTVNFLKSTAFDIFSNITAVFTYSVGFVINIFFMLTILFFLFKDGQKLGRSFYRILPFPDDIEKIVVNRLKDVIKILFAGNILIMICQGIIVGTVFYIFDVRMPLLWAMVTAILSLIPAIGTALIWVPVVIYYISTGYYSGAVIIGVLCLVGYMALENLIKPMIFGERLKFHPLVLFFLLLGSIQAFNLPGIIIGPILLTLFFSLWEIYKLLNEYSAEKNCAPDARPE